MRGSVALLAVDSSSALLAIGTIGAINGAMVRCVLCARSFSI